MLWEQLGSPLREIRLSALYALVMVEETNALNSLHQLWSGESDTEFQQTIAWAEMRIRRAQANGETAPAIITRTVHSTRPTTNRFLRPTAADIRSLLANLNASDRRTRLSAIVDLCALNNPVALGPLAMQFMRDPDPVVRQAAQQAGQYIYLNALYWQEFDTRNHAYIM
jgi:HEAT repeat protein